MKLMKRNLIAMLALSVSLYSCNDNALFEQEMYKNVVALISTSYHNNFEEIVPLTGNEVTGYISASVGGTDAPKQDLTILLEEENMPFDKYNWNLYDAATSLYAKLVPKDKYEIPDYKIVIKAGERTGRTLVKLRPDGLSPDSTYFISLVAKSQNNVELNEKKNNVLYKVMIYNKFASQAKNSFYSMTGLQNDAVTAASKQMYPLSVNAVRVIAGTEAFANNVTSIGSTAMILEVDDNNKVTIKPYKTLNIQQLDGDPRYPNVFKVEESFGRKFNVFLISYQYKIGTAAVKKMQEELRMEVTN